MRKNTLLIVLASAGMVACAMLMHDGLTYAVALLMALAVITFIHRNRSWVMNYTRWAKANPKKAQGAITGLQLALMGVGLMAGYNLKALGHTFSDATGYIATAVLVISFLSVPFMPKRCAIAIPKVVNRHRLGYLGVIFSSLALTAMVGNRIEDSYPNSPITQVLKTMDQMIFPDAGASQTELDAGSLGQIGEKSTGSTNAIVVFAAIKEVNKEIINPSKDFKKAEKEQIKAEKKEKKYGEKMEKRVNRIRRLLAGGACVAAIILIILLIIPLCAGICLMIFGVSGGGILAFLSGMLIFGLSLWGMTELAKWCKTTKLSSTN